MRFSPASVGCLHEHHAFAQHVSIARAVKVAVGAIQNARAPVWQRGLSSPFMTIN
jgi:hypothetical protein